MQDLKVGKNWGISGERAENIPSALYGKYCLIRTLAASLLLYTASDTSEHDPVSLKGSQWFLPRSQIPPDLEYPVANLKSQAHLQISWEIVREAFALSFHLVSLRLSG